MYFISLLTTHVQLNMELPLKYDIQVLLRCIEFNWCTLLHEQVI